MSRVRELLHPRGRLLVEVEPSDIDERVLARLEDASGRRSEPFPWARVGERAVTRIARGRGLDVDDRWGLAGRAFLSLRPSP
jgi:hypothetical protein